MVALRAERRDERLSYKLWEQPTPEFALESLSNSTWRADVGAKKRLYRRLGVREYWLFDAAGKRIKERLRGYRLRRGTGSRAHLVTYRLVPENRWGRRPAKRTPSEQPAKPPSNFWNASKRSGKPPTRASPSCRRNCGRLARPTDRTGLSTTARGRGPAIVLKKVLTAAPE